MLNGPGEWSKTLDKVPLLAFSEVSLKFLVSEIWRSFFDPSSLLRSIHNTRLLRILPCTLRMDGSINFALQHRRVIKPVLWSITGIMPLNAVMIIENDASEAFLVRSILKMYVPMLISEPTNPGWYHDGPAASHASKPLSIFSLNSAHRS